MSIFRSAIERKAEEAITFNPAVQTGYQVATADVVNSALKNPFFLTMNNMSIIEGESLSYLDAIKTGTSIAIKDTNGVSRDEIIFCNPKYSNPMVIGYVTGKVPNGTRDASLVTADIIFSGTNNQLPTVVGTQSIPTKVSNRTQTTDRDAANATNMSGNIGDGNVPVSVSVAASGAIVPTFSPFNIGDVISSVTFSLPDTIDENGNPVSKNDKTERGPYGNPIRSGTLKFGNAELQQYSLPNIAGGVRF